MWKNGKLAEGAPSFGKGIDSDLAEYGFSLLRATLSSMKEGKQKYYRKRIPQSRNSF